ncbi:dynein axonemal intermediate chain 3 [Xylocopa sonorina]|uniref:dynein axonemal intermediate chain 3 n=1 Tax=Xylocopa sonorina TaxID=1818115 RepID=UPI00403A8977
MEEEVKAHNEEREKQLGQNTQYDETGKDKLLKQSDETEQTKLVTINDGETEQIGATAGNVEGSEDSAQGEDFVYGEDYMEYMDYEHIPKYEKEGEEERTISSVTIDWEKEAKETVRLDTSALRERRKTIFELDSYESSGPSASDMLRLASKDYVPTKDVRYSVSLGVPGIARIDLSPLTQKVVGCIIGENVSTEYPWVYVRKEIIEDNIDLHEESSDFLPVKDEIRKFPNSKILIGYVPSLTEEGQFYICLTEEGRDVVLEYIQKQREDHENRVRTAVYKPLGEWKELGSGIEIETTIVKNTRPLLEIEVIGTADVLNAPIQLEDRNVRDIRDGYIELLPYRQVFENVPCRLLYNASQITPMVREMEVQTVLSVPTNCWVQYEYTYEPPDLTKFTEEQLESLKSFLYRFTDQVCEQLMLNATWDIYTNDYANLVRNIRDTQWPIPVNYKEHLSFHDERHVVDKVINDLCWHPLWTGIAFAAYTSYAKSQHLIGPKSDVEVVKASEDNFVLAWSFNDCLAPKLVLECPREVTSVAVNPIDGNLVVGGCANGQLILWHIPGKIEKVEMVVVHTPAQIKHRITIKSLITWMQEALGTSIVRPTAMSSLKDSQKAAVTQIIWISPYDSLDTNGRFVSLPENTSINDLSSQFVTASEDGTMAFWDLKLVERWKSFAKKIGRKKKGQLKRPEALAMSVSPFKKLDRILKPYYVLLVQHPDESRNMVITTISMQVPKFKKERVDIAPPTTDVTIRQTFKNIIKKPDFVMQPKIHVGTVEGDFGCVTWEGYDFTTDLSTNTETCRWSWFKKVHDGPITHSVRSKQETTWLATIGGKVYAIWKENLGVPIMWKKSDVGYTAVSWSSFRPSILILTRMDGSVELWDFVVKSEEPCVLQSLSGRIITGIYTHELYLIPQCVGFCDFNGILRMFLAPDVFLKTDPTTFVWLTNFIERQITRVKTSKSWTEQWLEANYKIIEKKRLAKEMEKKRQVEEKIRAAKVIDIEATVQRQGRSLKPWEIIEEAREKWKERELQHMQEVILEKKGLKKDDLEKQREPILKLRQDAQRKKERLKETIKMQKSNFEHTKNLFFPKHPPEAKEISLQPMPGKKDDLLTVEDTILAQEVMDMQRVDPSEEIIYHFMEVQLKALTDIQKNPFQHSFDWRKILMKEKSLTVSTEDGLRKINKSRKKFIICVYYNANSFRINIVDIGISESESEGFKQTKESNLHRNYPHLLLCLQKTYIFEEKSMKL